MHIVAVLNRDGGTLRTMDLDAFRAQLVAAFSAHGHTVECQISPGRRVEAALRAAAARGDVDAILAAGGDGTVSTAAGIAFAANKPLAVLPAGTMNLFARALGLPLDLSEALQSIAAGTVQSVDIATANKQPFVHQFGVGIHARLVRIREGMTYRSRIGKMLASLRAIGAAAVRPPRFEVELRTSNGVERQWASGVAISNNPLGDGHIPHADRLDAGLLGIYIAAPMTTPALLRLAVDVLRGTWRDSPMVSEQEVEAVTLSFPRQKLGAVAVVDGELIKLQQKVEIRLHAGALQVLQPQARADP